MFIEVLDIKVQGNASSESRADTCWRTDGHDEAIWRFSRLCKRA